MAIWRGRRNKDTNCRGIQIEIIRKNEWMIKRIWSLAPACAMRAANLASRRVGGDRNIQAPIT